MCADLLIELNKQREDYESLFPFVSKPSRYIGGEWNSIVKEPLFREKAVGVCLCFPDLYETGFANMGLEVLYQIVNRKENAYAERAFVPDYDLADLLRQKKWPLFSLESRTPLYSFDLIGFGLPYELCYTNILEALDLGGIPIHAADRDRTHPIVVGGGPCAVNPEPLADFFDCFVIGDGEEVISEIIEAISRHKNFGAKDRSQLLLELAQIRGVYVPSLYEVHYLANGTVSKVQPKDARVPEKVSYRQVQIEMFESLKLTAAAPVVPFLSTVHDRLNVEIQRGCPWRCRFCQIGFSSHAYREKSGQTLLKIVKEGLSRTGYDAVTLSGLSAADHSEILPLLKELVREMTAKRVSIGLPSTRVDRFNLELADLLQTVRRQTLTFAPEAGTERMRNVIRKELRETEIRQTLKIAYQRGWHLVKLYFMYGLPTETQKDLDGIIDLIRDSRRENTGLSFTCTLSPFIPKPHTPFQWHVLERASVLQEKLKFLKRSLPAKIRAHDLSQIELEGMLSRGDRRCAVLIETAWRGGARFDGWTDRFKYELWQKAYETTGLNPEFFCYRVRGEEEYFPWDHLEGGPEKKSLWIDYQKSLAVLAVNEEAEPVEIPPFPKSSLGVVKAQRLEGKTVQRLRFKMARVGSVRFLSHLEQIEMIRRAVRRADFPMAYSQGFHPQMECSFGPAISVGYESDCEYFDLGFCKKVEMEETRVKLSAELARGFSIVSVSRIPVFFPSLESLANRMDYEIKIPIDFLSKKNPAEWRESLEQFLERKDLFIEKIKHKSGAKGKKIFFRELILRMHWKDLNGGDQPVLFLSLKLQPGKNVKPEKIISLFLDLTEDQTRSLKVKRSGLYIQKDDGSFLNP